MQKITLSLCLLLIFTAVCMGQKATTEDELRGVYKKLDEALRTSNVEKLTQYYDTAYTLESDGKKMTRAEAIDQWKQILAFIKTVDKLETKIEKITLDDGLYLVAYSQTSSGKIQFPGSPVLPFTYSGKITDAWRREKDGTWHNMGSVEHQSDLKVNGESAKPPAS
ncbi:MAG: YybH family protein [Pyrinomonadaceae bacterium]